MLASLVKVVSVINKWLLIISTVALVVIILSTVVETTGRLANWVFGSVDIAQVMLALMVFPMLGYTQALKQHISIESLYSRFSHRAKLFVEIIMSFIALCISVLISWQAFPFFLKSMATGEYTQSLHILLWPFQSLIAIGGIMLSLQFIIEIFTSYQQLRMHINGNDR